MQRLVKRIFRREIQRPSSDQLWQMPLAAALPSLSEPAFRELPLEEQEASYLAARVKALSLSWSSILSPFQLNFIIHLFVIQKTIVCRRGLCSLRTGNKYVIFICGCGYIRPEIRTLNGGYEYD